MSSNRGASLIALAHFYERYRPRIKRERKFLIMYFHLKDSISKWTCTTNIIDASVPDIQVPTLVPKYTPMPNPWKRVFKRVLNDLGNKVRLKINSFSDWLISHIPSQVKKPTNNKLQQD